MEKEILRHQGGRLPGLRRVTGRLAPPVTVCNLESSLFGALAGPVAHCPALSAGRVPKIPLLLHRKSWLPVGANSLAQVSKPCIFVARKVAVHADRLTA